MAQSLVRAVLMIIVGVAGTRLSEAQVNEIAIAGGALLVVVTSLFWSRKNDEKLLRATPPTN